ncbi:Ribosome small subunit-stimulated GTPase EngC [Richelia intracellularis HM01]|nr:Ribosome small subunit-stimulated GTPase EngC [Richelia intracellularis HM01]
MVGDHVIIEEVDWSGARGAIAEVLPRTSEFDRPAIANVSQVLLLFAVAEPPLEPYQLSKFLVKAESKSLNLILCLNKSDLISSSEQESLGRRLSEWGYQALFISVYQQQNIEVLAQYLQDEVTVVAGASGVGKSSLINLLIPGVQLRVGEVSRKSSRGRHTTRHVELFELPHGGLLADTPGFNQPDLDCSPEELAYFFPEIRRKLLVTSCRFSNCLHRDEPDCVVRGNWERYEHYLGFLELAITHKIHLQKQGDPELKMKLKTKEKGKKQYEPKLEIKKYRRASRKTQLQKLQQLCQDSDDLNELI